MISIWICVLRGYCCLELIFIHDLWLSVDSLVFTFDRRFANIVRSLSIWGYTTVLIVTGFVTFAQSRRYSGNKIWFWCLYGRYAISFSRSWSIIWACTMCLIVCIPNGLVTQRWIIFIWLSLFALVGFVVLFLLSMRRLVIVITLRPHIFNIAIMIQRLSIAV